MIQRIAYYITAHGYGHGVRSTDILNALYAESPSVEIFVVSELPEWFLNSRLKFKPQGIRPKAFDVGMVQLDSVNVDLEATAERLEGLLKQWDGLVTQERAWLEESSIDVVVADIPGVPLEAAYELDLPCYAVGNFSWDWIYEEFVGEGYPWVEVIERFKNAYGKATELLELPFACPMESFTVSTLMPLVSVPGKNLRDDLSHSLGIPSDTVWVLLSFTTLEIDEPARQRIAALSQYSFLTIQPLNWPESNFYAVDPEQWGVPDIFATVDIVLSKPGYGVLSDCAVNDKPVVYVERTDFRETPFLIRELQRAFRQCHLPAASLYKGDIETALQSVMQQKLPSERIAADGGKSCAKHILQLL